ncbi:transposase [Streptomyces sp. NPDC002838]|uniref:transposase n=1 Tax=Streptomyces sp. NPDC002838 TaxID=3154436 RepID=UPI00332B67DB
MSASSTCSARSRARFSWSALKSVFSTGSKHHLICDGKGTPFKVITTAANVNDFTQTLTLVDGIPPVAGKPGRPRRRPDALLGDKGYDSNPNRRELRRRRICRSSPARAPRTSRTWASSATSSSRPSHSCTTSSGWPSAGKDASTCTTHSSPSPAASSAGDASRKPVHDRVTSSYRSSTRGTPSVGWWQFLGRLPAGLRAGPWRYRREAPAQWNALTGCCPRTGRPRAFPHR